MRRRLLSKTVAKIIALLSFALAFTSLVSTYADFPNGLGDTDWPMYQRTPGHTGQSKYTGIDSAPEILWQTRLPTDGVGESAPGMSIAADGNVYISSWGQLHALDPQSGNIEWSSAYAYHSRSTPAVTEDGSIYWGFADNFTKLTSNGDVVWERAGLSGNVIFASSPVIAEDGTIYFTHDGLFSFTPEGFVQWVHYFSYYTHSSPAIGPDGTIYTQSGDNRLYAFGPSGSIKWSRKILTSGNLSPSVADDGTVYAPAHTGELYAFDPDGTQKWVFQTDEAQFSTSSVQASPTIGSDGTIYIGTWTFGTYTDTVHIYAVYPDGSLKWKFPVLSNGTCNIGVIGPVVLDRFNRAFACADNSTCYGIAEDGSLLWEYVTHSNPCGWNRTSPLLVADGVMVILDQRGVVHGIYDPAIPRLHVDPQFIAVMTDYGTPVITRTLQITSTASPVAWTATTSPSASWITTSATGGTTPTDLQITLITGDLVTGTYSIDLQIAADPPNDYINLPYTIPIQLHVGIHRLYVPIVEVSAYPEQ